jgi:hypothetical protein
LSEQLVALYVWEKGWSLPEGFGSKKEFRIHLGKNNYVEVTGEHYLKKNGLHYDILQYAQNGKIGKKLHCKTGDDFGKQFIQCLGE